ncbi:MAG: hypothetical protein NTW61_05195 [Candidatus Melainabacteria bacterium]|nr:hypothetical protein [Candidatus Melainabacteria bacterium]
MMMMMSQPIQPNTNRSALPANFGSQGFITGRQRLQQQSPVTAPQNTPSFQTTRNQAFITTAPTEAPANLPPAEAVATPQRNQASNRPNANALPYQEIQDIAQKAGYVGVSQRDIDRAYRLNKSLLVDYRA